MNKVIKKMIEKIYYDILKKEGLNGWKIKWNTGSGLCVYTLKEIWMAKNNKDSIALFLHEVSHALCPKEKCGICWVETNNGHNVIWGDKYTELVKKYMKIK